METIIDRLKRIRLEKHLTQKQIADVCGITPSAYTLIEKGITKSFSLEIAKGIAKALKVPFNELFDIDNEPGNNETLKSENDNLKRQIEELQEIIVWYFVDNCLTDFKRFLKSLPSDISDMNEGMAKLEKINKKIKSYQEDYKHDIEMGYYTVNQYERLIRQLKRTETHFVLNLNDDFEKYQFWIPPEASQKNDQSVENEFDFKLPESLSDLELKPARPENNE